MSRSIKKYPHWSCPSGRGCNACGPNARRQKRDAQAKESGQLGQQDADELSYCPYYPFSGPSDDDV